MTFTVTQKFQPTLPARGATANCKPYGDCAEGISTHAPRTGSDGITTKNYFRRIISTHAPRTGSDVVQLAIVGRTSYFNPRSPHGERLLLLSRWKYCLRFQPTLPARGATRWTGLQLVCKIFQPTLPARGATREYAASVTETEISTHAPRTGSDGHADAVADVLPRISTHAPRTGSDVTDSRGRTASVTFQPTLPARGATGTISTGGKVVAISTHAPRTGSDTRRDNRVVTGKISTHAPRTGSDSPPKLQGV